MLDMRAYHWHLCFCSFLGKQSTGDNRPWRVMQISAKKGTGVDELLETVALTAELEQLMANFDKNAAGTILEAHLDKRVGAIATLLVQTGTLRIGVVVVAGAAYGKVRTGPLVMVTMAEA